MAARVRSHRRRSFRLLLIAAALVAAMAPHAAHADPAICVTLYYRIQNGPPQYVFNNWCQVPGPFGEFFTLGPECGLDSSHLDICETVIISLP